MIKKVCVCVIAAWCAINIYGCFMLLAGAAGGAGTAAWLSGKLTQEANVPFERSVKAVKSALGSLKLEITKETIEQDVAQIMSKYSDGKTVWVDVRRVTDASSRIEVRVGAVDSDKQAADKILQRIKRYL